MEIAEYLLSLLGGIMMGVALVYLRLMLSSSAEKSGTREQPGGTRSQLLIGFALGVLIGAYAIARLVPSARLGSVPMVILGGVLGAMLAHIFASSTRRGR